MKGLRVVKNYWPKPKVLAWPDGFGQLPRVLQPLTSQLDNCWWYLGGQGFSVGKGLGHWVDEFVTKGGMGGRPGFFSRLADGLSPDWKIYFAVDELSYPEELFIGFDQVENKWFEWPELVPQSVCLLVRGVDSAYWDILFRDDWMFDAVRSHLDGQKYLKVEIGCRTF